MQEGCREVKASLGYRVGAYFAVIFIFLSGVRVEDVAQVTECWTHTHEALCSAQTVVVQTCNPAPGGAWREETRSSSYIVRMGLA